MQEERKMHIVSWESLQQLGGLGFKRLKEMNRELLPKLAWRMMENPNTLWARSEFYGRNMAALY